MSVWARVRLADVMDLDVEVVEVDADASYPVVGVLNRGRGLLYRDTIGGSETKYKTLNLIRPGQVVYSRLKAFEGAITVAPDGLGEAYASQEFPTFTIGPGLLPAYFALVTSTQNLWNDLQNLSTGMGGRRERVKPSDFLTISLSLPPLVEQLRIVNLVASLDAQLATLANAMRQTDGLWWRLSEKLVSDVRSVETTSLGEIADLSGGLTKNKKDLLADDLVEVPYLRVANVHRRYLDLSVVATILTTKAKAESLRLRPGDILLNEGGDKDKLGRGAVWRGEVADCVHQNHVFRARVSDEGYDERFVSAWANSFGQRWFETYGTQTTGIASINKTTLSRFPVPVLPKADQVKWADAMDGTWEVHAALAAELAALRSFRVTLLAALLSQAIAIPDSYDALLEPAS